MNNTILSSKNTFSEGLIMDFAPDNTQSNCLTSALNATLLTFNGNEMSLLNDMGNGRVETARLPDGYVPVGSCEFGDIIYIVSYNPILNKSQIGCFPSPERNISSEEIGDTKQTLSAFDFQELDGSENPTGKLKNSSVKKVLYDSKDMTSGDKYIVYSKNINGDNSKYLSDFGNTSHKYGTFPKLVKIHVVSIEDSGKIVYLDSTTKWYNNNYFINGDGELNADNKLDIDSYRSLVTSAYSIFSSKVSGKLALLVELEKITGFSCSWEPYVKNKTDEYIDYDIFWNFNWTTNDNNINPNGALLTHSKWVSNSTIKLPDVNTEFGPSILFNRNYKPEENINYDIFIENYEYNKYLSNTLSSLTNTGITPYKVVIDRTNTGAPVPGKYYVNCTNVINQNNILNISNTDVNTNNYINTYVDKDHNMYIISKSTEVGLIGIKYLIQCLTNPNKSDLINFETFSEYTISSICDGSKGYYISGYNFDSEWFIFYYNNGIIEKIKSLENISSEENITNIQCLSYNNGILYVLYTTNLKKYIFGYDDSFNIIFNSDKLINFSNNLLISYDKSDNSLIFLKIKTSTSYTVYKQFIVDNILDKKLFLGTVNVKEGYSLNINLVENYLYVSQYKDNRITVSKNEISNYKAYSVNSTGEEIQISSKTIKDDIINNYFNYSVIKPFTVMNSEGKLENFTFRIPNDENNLIYHYKIAPTMPYGYLEEYTQEGYIDFSKIGKKNIKLHTWKYYNYENTSTLTWGMDAYTEEGKGIQEVVFEFYDNQGFAAAYHIKDKNSFNGTFTDYILLNNFGSNYKLNNYNYKNLRKYHKGIHITAGNAEEGKTYLTEGNNPIYNIVDSSELIYEDDCGILYPNCLYLVKIIAKYSSKDILGNYTESESEYVYDYRWYWTNSMFNKHYQNELDFNNLLFELGLNCITHLYTSPTYQVNRINYGPDTIDDVESINDTLSANILYVNLDNEQEDNIRLSITPGLLNDFNTFNLNQAKVNELKASIYLGDEYVTNIVEQPNVIYSEHKITDDVKILTPISSILKSTETETENTETTELPQLESPSIFYSELSDKYTIKHNNVNAIIHYAINDSESYTTGSTNIVSLSGSDVNSIHTYASCSGYLDSPVVSYLQQTESKARVILDKYSNFIEDELVGGSGSLNLNFILPPTILPLGCSFTENENLNITITGEGIIYYKIVPKDKKQEEFNYTEISPNETDINRITIGIKDSCTVYAYVKNGRATSSTISQKYTRESIPEISNTDDENHINNILSYKVSRTLYTKLGLLDPGNLGEELYDGNYESYVNTFKLVPYVTDGQTWTYESESQDSIPYQSSSGELKTTNGLTKYSTSLSNVLLKDGKYFPLSLSGIHYSKYTYEIKLSENVPIIRSFVLTESDLENYNIKLYNTQPYFNKMLFTSYVDRGGESSEQHTAILSFVRNNNGYSQSKKHILDTYKGGDTSKISVYSGLNINYDSISNEFKFLFPFGYGHGNINNEEANHTKAYRKDKNKDEDDKLVSNNKCWHVETNPNYTDEDLGGTIAGIAEETIHPADQHTYENSIENALEKFAPAVLGMLTQLYYILNSNNNINVPYNYIYLEPNKYSYKRDLIVGISPNIENHDDLILFRGMYYSDFYDEQKKTNEDGYVSQVIKNSGLDDIIKGSLKSHINVKLKLESLMLTSPLEYNADYITPEQEGESNYYLVKSVFDDVDNKVKMSAINDGIYGWDHVSKSFVPYRSLQTIKKIEKVRSDGNLLNIKANENNNSINLSPIINNNSLAIGSDNSLMLKRIPDSIATYSVTTHDNKDHDNDTTQDKYLAMTNYKKFTFYNE